MGASHLAWRHFPADERGFLRAPVLLSGSKQAMLIDGGFTLSDGRAVTEAIRASGKELTLVYVSQSDPDYYFGLGPICAAFPEARVIAAPATVDAIERSVQKKLEFWSPTLGDNGPRALADIVMPRAEATAWLEFEGEAIEVVDADTGFANRRYLWVPALQAVFGGVLVFGDLHVWTADAATHNQRAAWLKTLEAIVARNPKVVVPGHLKPGSATDLSAVFHTGDYLVVFEMELARAKDSAGLVKAMTERYPNAGLKIALEIGAKVAKGEMKWG
jgi:glyoxylase-like metal-dependent hydrolase (beta-lactamase superfamily II)